MLGRAVMAGRSLSAMAALTLLGRLTFVDIAPSSGPDLIQVLDTALHRSSVVQATASAFLETVRHVRGDSVADRLVERIAQAENELVIRACARLAVMHSMSPSCSPSDRRRIRQALRAAAAGEVGKRRPVFLVGIGSDGDPMSLHVGPETRRAEFRRLLTGTDHPPMITGE